MEKCITSNWFVKTSFFSTILGCSIGIFIFLTGVVTYIQEAHIDIFTLVMCLILILIGILVCCFMLFTYAVDSREFFIDEKGFTIRYLKKFCAYYTWNEVSNIIICDIYHAPKDSSRYEEVIRIAIGNEKNGPYNKTPKWSLSGYETWRTYEYALTHFQKIISLTYNSDRFEQIQKYSQRGISKK